MGLFGAVTGAIGDVAGTVTRAASSATHAVSQVGTSVARASSSIARAAVDDATRGARIVGSAVQKAAPVVANAAKATGTWAWDHKLEIGMWVGTAALLAAVPMTGGASTAAVAGIWGARAAAIGARVATAGRVGATAVRAAQAGAAVVRGSTAARIMGGAGGAVRGARLALGATRVGRGVAASARPLGVAATGLSAVSFVDEARKLATGGGGSLRSLALSGIGLIPAIGSGAKSLAGRAAARAEVRAAETVASKLAVVDRSAARIDDAAAAVARGTREASVASAVQQDAAKAVAVARAARYKATTRLVDEMPTAAGADAATLGGELRQIEKAADAAARNAARVRTGAVSGGGGTTAPVSAAATVERELARTRDVAREARRVVERNAVTVERMQKAEQAVVATAETTKVANRYLGAANSYANMRVNQSRGRNTSADAFGLARSLLGIGLARNAAHAAR